MERRIFLKRLVLAGAALRPGAGLAATAGTDALGPRLPLRPLGRTGEQVTCLGLGGFHIGWIREDALAQATIETALEEGLRFFDTAESYSRGRGEERYGRFLVPKYRDRIFLMTKTQARNAAAARKHLEGSLRRLNTDVIDLWQVHALGGPEDAAARLENGVLDVALEAKEQGKVRHIGFTGHASPYAHRHMLDSERARNAFETCQMPVNPVDVASKHSFVKELMPDLEAADYGVIAMKTLADGRFFAEKTVNGKVWWRTDDPVVPVAIGLEDCIHFALSLPISVLVTGAENPEFVREKATFARRFQRLDEPARAALVDKVAAFAAGGAVEYYKNDDLKG